MSANDLTNSSANSSTKANPLIEIVGVHKRYGQRRVLRGIDLAVPAGRSVALLGNNGAGKTTLMRLIAGLAKADKGEIRLGGAALKNAGNELRRYIGLVSHTPFVYENLTGLENLNFFADLYDLVDVESRVESLLTAVDLWTRRHDLVRTYSRGMLQRLAIARSVLHDPPVLLLDEPDTGLDQVSIELLQQLIQDLGSGQRAILFSTHVLENALAWSDQICMVSGGRIVGPEDAGDFTVESLRDYYSSTANGGQR